MIKSKIQIMALIVSYVHLRFLNTLGIKFYEIFAGVRSDIYSPENFTSIRPVTWLSTDQSDVAYIELLKWVIISFFYSEKFRGNEKVSLRWFLYKCNRISNNLWWFMVFIQWVLWLYPRALASHKTFFLLHSINLVF